MRRSAFLAELRAAVCGAADRSLSEAGQSTEGCPWLEYWMAYYSSQGASHIEGAIRKFAPEAATATSARDYIPIVAERVRQGAARYAESGEIPDVPQDMTGAMALGGMVAFKGREGGARPPRSVPAIRRELGAGQPLEGGVRSQMESAFGAGFSHVRFHSDGRAARLSNDLNARAFTVGEHVAFGAGEYRPGTLVGNALIAHELAHVLQQRDASPSRAGERIEDGARQPIEEDADRSAAEAVLSMWTRTSSAAMTFPSVAVPRFKSGLALRRCKGKEGDSDPKRFEEIKKVLQETPTGRDALKTMEDYKVGVRFVKGGPHYDPDSNTMLLSYSQGISRSALAFAHELYHAKRQNEGTGANTTANIKKLSREDYVNQMIEEEAEGTVRAIEEKIELEGTKIDVSKDVYPLESEYRAAYKAAVDAAKAKDPAVTDDALKAIGRAAGKKRLIEGIENGEVKAGDSGQNYRVYYGKGWDDAH
jgi:hypothetical protein